MQTKNPVTIAFLVIRNYSQLNIINWQFVVHTDNNLLKMI